MPRWLKLRNGLYSYYRRVPTIFADIDSRPFAEVALGTRDRKRAEKLRDFHNREQEKLWVALKRGGSTDARERYLGAIERARIEGFEYRTASDLADQSLGDITARIDRLEELFPGIGDPRGPKPAGIEVSAVAGLIGTAVRPELTLSTACEEFFRLTRAEVRKKSPDQLRRWRAPRRKAVNNLIAIEGIGDKPVSQVSRADALAFRAWWVDRVVDQGYSANAANKDIGHLAQIIDRLSADFELGMTKPFGGLRLRDDQAKRRAAFTNDEVLTIVTDPRHLAGLNAEARGIVLAMVETGMRPIEICNLTGESIVLDGPVPHVKVQAGENLELKTVYSAREIPLVGISLEAFRANPDGFPRYRDKSSQLSALVNPFLQRRGLLPTPDHSLYSIRHNFKDRLMASDMQDRIQDELMGHKSPRPVYGTGPSLEHKREWLLKIAITGEPPPADPAQGRLL